MAEPGEPVTTAPRPRWVRLMWLIIGVLLAAALLVHVLTGGFGGHG